MAPRRSPRLHPQIHAREEEEGVGIARRRSSPHLHPQILASGEGAGVTRRRSPRLHPQILASEQGGGLKTRRVRRRRGTSRAAPESLPFNDDMLREILLRLPPQPSSLLRASAVCKRWRSLVSDTKFLRLFRAHHRKAPLLGVFVIGDYGMVFKSILDPPDRIPPQRFDPRRCYSAIFDYSLLDCRHGCLLYRVWASEQVLVCDPMTGQHRRLVAPPEFVMGRVKGAVLCATSDHGHVHGVCHLRSYKVVLVSSGTQPIACVYSLQTGEWGSLIATEAPCEIYDDIFTTTAILVGNVLYWLFKSSKHRFMSDRILAFDLDRQNLAVTVGPPVTNEFLHGRSRIIQAEDGAVGFGILAHPHFQMWQRNVNGHGVGTWVPWKTIEMHNILGLPSLQAVEELRYMLGYDEDNDVLFVHASNNVYAVQLKSMHSKKLYGTNYINLIYPFTSFYTPGTTINGGSNGAEMLHDA